MTLGPESYSLYELNEFIKRTVALNFVDPIWVRCEIAECKVSRGHYYLTIAEKNDTGLDIIARANAILWESDFRQTRRKRGAVLKEILRQGTSVMLHIQVDYHEKYGFRMLIKDIDPAFTIGQLEQRKRATIQLLEKEGLLHKNKSIDPPLVIQRLAVVSSRTAAGYIDFKEQLLNNEYAYDYSVRLFPSAVQGPNMVKEMSTQLDRITKRSEAFDAVLIIRGGGGRLDLVEYDDEVLCRKISQMPLPVFTGIGHEIDETVADMVAYRSLKTPTAAAEFLIHRSLNFESHILQMMQYINSEVSNQINQQRQQIDHFSTLIKSAATNRVERMNLDLDQFEKMIPLLVKNKVKLSNLELEGLARQIALVDPQSVLNRGFGVVTKDSQVVRSSSELKKGDDIKITFSDGDSEARIE